MSKLNIKTIMQNEIGERSITKKPQIKISYFKEPTPILCIQECLRYTASMREDSFGAKFCLIGHPLRYAGTHTQTYPHACI